MSDLQRQPDAQPETLSTRTGLFGPQGSGDTSGYGRLVRTVELGGITAPPYGGYFDDLLATLRTALAEHGVNPDAAIEKAQVHVGELTVFVVRDPAGRRRVLRDVPELRFELCRGVSGVHYPDDAGRELYAVYRCSRSRTTASSGWKSCAPIPTRTSQPLPRLPDQRLARAETYDSSGSSSTVITR